VTHLDDVTVLICTWNRAALLEETLVSLACINVPATIHWGVVIVDDNKGISRARMEIIHPVTELGLDLRQVPTIGGVPRFLFGSAVHDLARWLQAAIRGDRGARFAAETQLWYFGGQLRERLRQR